ncbi:MAG TPA: lipopolysaccharide assembly protein LapA domain-containing protein [Stellaceae bacterium]|nr:lipopolysaccharide assembly protein LapA domain-containing protein [Stellaceae bacterium]
MKVFHWLVTLPLAVILAVFAVSNRVPVDLTFWPLPFSLQAPLYLVTLVLVLVGYGVGEGLGLMRSLGLKRRLRRQAKRIVALEAALAEARAKPPGVSPAPIAVPALLERV